MGFTLPPKKFYGDHPTITGDRKVAQLPATKAANPPIDTDRWFRNGRHPDASVFNELNTALNQAMLFRTKEVFSILGAPISNGQYGPDPFSTNVSRPRWRFAFHTSPYTHALYASATMVPQSDGFGTDAYSTLKIYSDATESTLVSETEFHYGPNPGGTLAGATTGGWQYHRTIDKFVDGLSADTDYFGVWTDEPYCRLLTACIADIQSMTENYNGYLPTNFTEQSQLLDSYRQNLVTPIPAMWKRGGAKVLQWTSNIQSSPRTRAATTSINLIDGSTTVSASTAGYTLDMTGKARLSQSGVPCVMKAYGWMSTGSGLGRVKLLDSGGGTVAQIHGVWGATPQWGSVAFELPASEAKYDLHIDNGAGTGSDQFNLSAVSIYEYEA